MSSKIAILPFLTECESSEDELNVAFDIEINQQKIKQSGYRLIDLIENKIENYNNIIKSNSEFRDEIIGNLELEINQIEKCKERLKNYLEEVKKNNSKIIVANR